MPHMLTRLLGDSLSAIVAVAAVLLLLAGQGMLLAIGLLLLVISYRLWVIAHQQRGQTELLALIAEGQDT